MILGITGGIGSGKSLATDYLSSKYGFTSIKTDDLAKELMNSDADLKKMLIDAFGPDIYAEDGSLNKTVYASLIYADPLMRSCSDRIVHPAVWTHVKRITGRKNECGRKCGFAIETALPGIELRSLCDEIWHIRTEPEIRVGRLMRDRGYSEEYARSVISGQISEEEYSSMADHVIDNSTDVGELYRQIDRLLQNRV